MILQSFLFPDEVCGEPEIYYRVGIKQKAEYKNQMLIIDSGGQISSDSYMNLFDAETWRTYTKVMKARLCLQLYGSGTIGLWLRNETEEKCVQEQIYNSEEREIKEFIFSTGETGFYYFTINAKTRTIFQKAEYQTYGTISKNEIFLSLVICTYKRKKQLTANIEKLLKSLFFDKTSKLYQKMFVHIVDNASEIQIPVQQNIAIHYERNLGGSGGFTRGIEEIQKVHSVFPATNIILMDDDTEFQLETFYRIYAVLSLLKEEYRKEVIAGRMFQMDDRKIQYTASEIWNGGHIIHMGENKNMCRKDILVKVNRERGEYSGWWLTTLPYAYTINNLPFPYFLHCDDVEYGLRHGGVPLVWNGIQVWHEAPEYRNFPILAYYDMRNPLSVNCLHGIFREEGEIYRYWKERISAYHSRKEFFHERMAICGMRDFLKGAIWLSQVDGEKNHRKLERKKYGFRYVNAVSWRMVRLLYQKKIQKILEEYKRLRKEYEVCCYVQAAKDIDKRFY